MEPLPIVKPAAEVLIHNKNNEKDGYKVYRMRWFMLYLLVMCTVCTSMQYVQYSIIADVVVDFYGVTYTAVDWSVMILSVSYVTFNVLGLYVIQKIGNRNAVIVSITGSCLANWIKVASVHPNRYWVVLVGQGVLSISQTLIIPLPVQFASTWFGKDQVALATGIALSGIQLGCAIGFVIPPMLVKATQDKTAVAYNMYVMNIGFALTSALFLILSVCFFKADPPTSPSRNQKQLEDVGRLTFKESTKRLFKKRSFNLILVAYSINGGVYNTIPTLLNQLILYYFPEGSEDAGRIGLLLLITAIIGSTTCGYVLDKFQKYKITAIVASLLYLLGMMFFALSFTHSITLVYVASIFMGMFMSATNSVGLQVAAQLTRPLPESISSGYLSASAEIAGIAIIYIYSFILYKFGAFWSNALTCIDLCITTVLIMCI